MAPCWLSAGVVPVFSSFSLVRAVVRILFGHFGRRLTLIARTAAEYILVLVFPELLTVYSNCFGWRCALFGGSHLALCLSFENFQCFSCPLQFMVAWITAFISRGLQLPFFDTARNKAFLGDLLFGSVEHVAEMMASNPVASTLGHIMRLHFSPAEMIEPWSFRLVSAGGLIG